MEQQFCRVCQTPLTYRYLRILDRALPSAQVHTVIGGRYWVLHPQWVLELQPGLPPLMPEALPESVLPYLHLAQLRHHLPQIYGELPEQAETTWLLEYPPFPHYGVDVPRWPHLTDCWAQGDAFNQVHWLWQIARLWEPLHQEGVASSLLFADTHGTAATEERLWLRGRQIFLDTLSQDVELLNLADLGYHWRKALGGAARDVIRPFFLGVCEQLETGAIATPNHLVTVLETALNNLSGLRDRTYHLVAGTDTGPSRQNNEDACYPETTTPLTSEPLIALVCDGIGGHEGGEVASAKAIAIVQEALQTRLQHPEVNGSGILQTWEQSILQANEQLCAQNDAENRAERQRMGTTLVGAVLTADALYYAHVGDSRLYWLTEHGCYPLTLDDDVAAREVRLGYALWRDSLTFPGGGSLLQALGMGPRVYPHLDRVILDEPGLVLLCSDGLSDGDRVEQHWQTELLPILTGERSLAETLPRLIQLANQTNGHDNVTVAIVQVQVEQRRRPLSPLAVPAPQVAAKNGGLLPASSPEDSTTLGRQALPQWLLTSGILLVLLVGGGLLSLLIFPEWRYQVSRLLGNTGVASVETTSTPPPQPAPTPGEIPTFTVESLFQLPAEVPLYATPNANEPPTVTPDPNQTWQVRQRLTVDTPESATVWLEIYACGSEPAIVRWLPEIQAQTAAIPVASPDCGESAEKLLE